MTDQQLLEAFVHEGDEGAFATLAARHADWLYSACRRRLNDRAKAEDAAQAVLMALARKAPALVRHTSLMGWLYQAARIACADIQRTERRRLRLEAEVAKMMTRNTSEASREQWQQIEPHLEASLDQLSQRDRLAILMRFYERQSHAQIGEALGISPAAAEKRVSRAMDRLKVILQRRAGTFAAASLTAMLGHYVVSPAPKALVATLCNGALARSPHLASVVKSILFAGSTIRTKIVVTSAAACVVVGAPLAMMISSNGLSGGQSARGEVATASTAPRTARVSNSAAAEMSSFGRAKLTLAWDESNVPRAAPSDQMAAQAAGIKKASLSLSWFDHEVESTAASVSEAPVIDPARLTLTLGWNGQRFMAPEPPTMPLSLQLTQGFQHWTKVGNPQTFEQVTTNGNRYLVEVAGVAQAPNGHPLALVPRIARFRPGGSLEATSRTVPREIPGWNIAGIDGKSAICAVTEWTTYAEDGQTPRLTLSTSQMVPGVPPYLQTVTFHEPDGSYRQFTANSRGVVFQELSFDAQGALRGVVNAAMQFSEQSGVGRVSL